MNIKRFSNFPQSIDPVKSQTILEQFLELNNNFGVLNENLQAIDANFEQVQEEFTTLENEFAETQRKVNSLESEIETLPAQVAQNTSDIAELKQREDKQGTIVKVNGQAVATWSPDIMSTDIATNRDNIQQVTQAQASDSLAIVALQSDNITNKQNISSLQTSVSNLDSDNATNKSNISSLQTNVSNLNSDNTTNKSSISALQTNVSDLQGDVSTLNQQQARSLKTPTTAPTETELVGVDSTNSQVLIPLSQIGGGGGGLEITTKNITCTYTSESASGSICGVNYTRKYVISLNESIPSNCMFILQVNGLSGFSYWSFSGGIYSWGLGCACYLIGSGGTSVRQAVLEIKGGYSGGNSMILYDSGASDGVTSIDIKYFLMG